MFFKKNKKILETANVLIEKFNSIDSRINKLEHTIDRAIKESKHSDIDNIIKDKLESIFNNFVPKKEFNNHFAALLQLSNNIFESVNKIKYSTNKEPIEELK